MSDPLAFVLHEFHAEDRNDLSISPGNIIEIISWVNEDWIKGRNQFKQTGIFPANHVKVIQQSISWPDEGTLCIAKTAADPNISGLLSYQSGDFLIGQEIYGDDSYLGYLKKSPQRQGLIRLVDVVPFKDKDYNQYRPAKKLAIAIQNSTGQISGELSFQKDDRISILREEDNVFYYGRIEASDGSVRNGLVPKYAVQMESEDNSKIQETLHSEVLNSSQLLKSNSVEDNEPSAVLRAPPESAESSLPSHKLVANRISKVIENILSLHESHLQVIQLANETTTETNYSSYIRELFNELDHLMGVYEQYTSTVFSAETSSTVQSLETIRKVHCLETLDDPCPDSITSPRSMSPNTLMFLDPISCNNEDCQNEESPTKGDQPSSVTAPEEKRLKQKSFAIRELIESEKHFHEEVKQLIDAFNPAAMLSKVPDEKCSDMFINLEKIKTMSSNLVQELEKVCDDEALIGEIFINLKNEIFESYCKYMVNFPDANKTFLSEEVSVRNYVEEGLRKYRSDDKYGLSIDAILIKPVQRLMKYPLLLQSIAKFMDPSSPDHETILKAASIMMDINNRINEKKRAKELTDRCLGGRGSIFSSNAWSPVGTLLHARHSITKKVGRLSQTMVNLATGGKLGDESFDELVERFHKLKKTVKILHTSISACRDCIECILRLEAQLANSIVQLLNSPSPDYKPIEAASTFARISLASADEFCTSYHVKLNRQVISPLHQVHRICGDPKLLLKKRKDKLLDKERLQEEMRRVEKSGNPINRQLEEQFDIASKVYQAMHTQLLEDLPKFNSIVHNIVAESMAIFVSTIKYFIANYLPKLISLQQSCESIYDELIYEDMSSMDNFKLQLLDELSGLGLNFDSPVTTRSNTTATDRMSLNLTLPSRGSVSPLGSKAQPNRRSCFIDRSDATFPGNSSFPVSSRSSTLIAPKVKGDQEQFRSSTIVRRSMSPSNSNNNLSKESASFRTTWYVQDAQINNAAQSSTSTSTIDQNKLIVNQSQYQDIEEYAKIENITKPPIPTNSHVNQVYRAAYTFTARKANELSISAGDELLELRATDESGNSDWKLMFNPRSNSQGFVPSNYVVKL